MTDCEYRCLGQSHLGIAISAVAGWLADVNAVVIIFA